MKVSKEMQLLKYKIDGIARLVSKTNIEIKDVQLATDKLNKTSTPKNLTDQIYTEVKDFKTALHVVHSKLTPKLVKNQLAKGLKEFKQELAVLIDTVNKKLASQTSSVVDSMNYISEEAMRLKTRIHNIQQILTPRKVTTRLSEQVDYLKNEVENIKKSLSLSKSERRPKILMCLVGADRTFSMKVVHKNLRENVYKHFSKYADVDVKVITFHNTKYSVASLNNFHGINCAHHEEFVKESSFRLHLNSSTESNFHENFGKELCPVCNEPGHLQMAWVDACFVEGDKSGIKYDYYLRVRPDGFFGKPLPKLNFYNDGVLYTTKKHDSKGSDKVLFFSKWVYENWWIPGVRRILRSSDETIGLYPDYKIFFVDNTVVQQLDTPFCLVRNSDLCQSWMGEEPVTIFNFLRKSDDNENCTLPVENNRRRRSIPLEPLLNDPWD
eukprot:Pgem_evm1s221